MLESKRRALILLLVSFLLAAIAGFLFLQKYNQLNANLGGMTTVYVAATDVPSRTLILKEYITTMEIPNKFVTKSNVTNIADLENKVFVVPLSKGDIITKNVIKPVSNVRNENNRLVTVYRTEKVFFDQELEALDRVDIIVSHEFDGKPKTEVFMKDVPVAMALRSNNAFAGVAVEVKAEDATKLIHMQNYASSIRILKSNVGKSDQLTNQAPVQQKPEEKSKETPTPSTSEQTKQDVKAGAEQKADSKAVTTNKEQTPKDPQQKKTDTAPEKETNVKNP